MLWFKGTVSIISSDHPCKDHDGNARFTTVLLKVLSDEVTFYFRDRSPEGVGATHKINLKILFFIKIIYPV